MALFAEKYYKGSDKSMVLQKLYQVAVNIGCAVSDLDTVIFAESAWNPKAYNASSGAYGFIQWLNSTAKDIFGITAQEMGSKDAITQLGYVEKYYLVNMKRLGQKVTDKYELYLVVFHPASVGKPDSFLILDKAKNLKGYNGNAGLDANKNGQITKGEVKLWFDAQLKKKALLKA